MKKMIMQLDTLTCPSCMQKIEHAVSQQPGVSIRKFCLMRAKSKQTLIQMKSTLNN